MKKYMCPFECFSSTFAERIKWLRENEKLSLQDVANEIGISKAHLWTMEQGQSDNPGLKVIRSIATFFKVPTAALVEDETTASFRKKIRVRITEVRKKK